MLLFPKLFNAQILEAILLTTISDDLQKTNLMLFLTDGIEKKTASLLRLGYTLK